MIVSITIAISQFTNLIIGGGNPKEMLCSWAWRNRLTDTWAAMVVVFFDRYAWPINLWRFEGKGHCESCWINEIKRAADLNKSLEPNDA